MAHYALLDENNVVTWVITGNDEDFIFDGVESWEDYYGAFHNQRCVRTSYNTYGGIHYSTDEDGNRVPSEDQSKALRKNYAGIGFSYDDELDAFIPPKPEYGDWVLNSNTGLWESADV